MHLSNRILKAQVEEMLLHPLRYEWSIQGFGMLRAYFAERTMRLHIWDDRYRVPDVTLLHDHPWNFSSYIVAGQVEQYRYAPWDGGARPFGDALIEDYTEETIQCGPGGFACNTTAPRVLKRYPLEVYRAGQVYQQAATEIHCSLPVNGTITIIERKVPEGASPDHAHVYYKPEAGWVSAEPRPATPEEIVQICQSSLDTWFRA